MIDAILEEKTVTGIPSVVEKHNVEESNNDANVTVITHDADATSVLSARSNIYDHDEFDVFHHGNIDLSRVHIGKR